MYAVDCMMRLLWFQLNSTNVLTEAHNVGGCARGKVTDLEVSWTLPSMHAALSGVWPMSNGLIAVTAPSEGQDSRERNLCSCFTHLQGRGR